MRIGMLVDVYKPYVSGVTHYVASNKRMLEAVGHDVYVFTFRHPHYHDDEANVIRSPALRLAKAGWNVGFAYSPRARALLETMDVVHVHHPFLSGRLALRYCRPLKIPIVFTNHTRYDLYARAYLPMLPKEVGEAFLQSYLAPFCRAVDLVIAPSAGLERVLRLLNVDAPVHVIPNGIDLTPYQHPPRPERRAELGIPDGDVLVVYAGRVAREKNLPTLLQAFARVVSGGARASLLIVGGGPALDDLRALAVELGLEGRVRFTGQVAHEELPAYLAAADAFATASVSEVHPLSVIEAMAAGLPVLGIRSPGVADTIVDGVTGLVCADDLDKFSAGLARLIGDAALRAQMGAAARAEAGRYALSRTSARVLEEYSRLVERRRTRLQGRSRAGARDWTAGRRQ